MDMFAIDICIPNELESSISHSMSDANKDDVNDQTQVKLVETQLSDSEQTVPKTT